MEIGIIGCGTIAQVRHAPEYHRNPACRLAAFYNTGREKAEQMAAQYGGVCCGSLEELLKLDLDAVSICTSNDTHARIALKALQAGMHVLCEKPMAMTVRECEQMTEAARAKSRILMIGNNQRLTSAHQKARELIQRGEIGKILSFETVFVHRGPDQWTGDKDPWFFHKEKAGLGALGDLGIHKLDLIQHLLGEDITGVTGRMETLDKTYPDGSRIAVEDNVWAILETGHGVIGSMHAGWTCYGQERNSFVIYGTEGVLRCYDDENYTLILEKGDIQEKYQLGGIQNNDDQKAGFAENSGVIDEFVSSILEGRQPICSGEDNLQAMRAAEALQKSAKEGRRIAVAR
ncbi:MAG: Gfo/Idh/MocA family oxidoreductase [Lachnospiraceae bacterium]|nr:Gfo/Idh/MocA family oxidoreductase [Lachnospiraceae bacterium]